MRLILFYKKNQKGKGTGKKLAQVFIAKCVWFCGLSPDSLTLQLMVLATISQLPL